MTLSAFRVWCSQQTEAPSLFRRSNWPGEATAMTPSRANLMNWMARQAIVVLLQ